MTNSRMMISALAFLLALPALVGAQQVAWHHDMNSARTVATSKNLPIVIDFGTANCYWCKQLDATTFRDPTVAKLLAEKFVAVKIDAAKDPALTQSMSVQAFPTLIFAAPDGKVLGRQEGYVDAPQLQIQLRKAIAQCSVSNSIGIGDPSNGTRPTQAVQAPVSLPQAKFRMQAPDQPTTSFPPSPFVLPSPEALGLVVNVNPSTRLQESTIDHGDLFVRLRRLGAVGFHLARIGPGHRASIDVPGAAGRIITAEGHGASEASAIANALANAAAIK